MNKLLVFPVLKGENMLHFKGISVCDSESRKSVWIIIGYVVVVEEFFGRFLLIYITFYNSFDDCNVKKIDSQRRESSSYISNIELPIRALPHIS